MIKFGIVTHGGVGAPKEWSDGCKKAAEAGFKTLKNGGPALDAVIQAAVILENDGRFNAGSGSDLRLDGKTIECDASLMDSDGNLGIVINVQNVKNPVLLARKVMGTPHVILAGRGAENFAKLCDLYRPFPPTDSAIEKHRKRILTLREKNVNDSRKAWNEKNIKELWNYDREYSEIIGCDTIGAVAIDTQGNLAVACSTGGASPMMLGRVGDSPIPGAGFYASKHAAICSTGIGEEIIKRMLAINVHNSITQGASIEKAVSLAIKEIPANVSVGLIAISPSGFAINSNKEMASFNIIETQ